MFLTGGGAMNDYIFTCERSNVTSTFAAFFGQNRCFISVRRYFQPNRPKKTNLNFFDRCETLPLRHTRTAGTDSGVIKEGGQVPFKFEKNNALKSINYVVYKYKRA